MNKLFGKKQRPERRPPVMMYVCNPGAVFHVQKLWGEGKEIIPVGTAVMVYPVALPKAERCEVLYNRRGGWMYKAGLSISKPIPVEAPADQVTYEP